MISIRRNGLDGELKHQTSQTRDGATRCVRGFEKGNLPSAVQCECSEVFGYCIDDDNASLFALHVLHIVNEFSILSSGATSPRVGGLIDSRRHVRAESAAVQHSLGAGEEPFFFRMTDSSHPLRGSALLMRAGRSLGFASRRTLESERPGSCRHRRCGAVGV